jgi:DNA polymerase-1
MSATEPAIQTLPRAQTDVNVRNSFIVPDGFQIVSTDFTNVEARIFAHFAQEEPMLEVIRAGTDLHGFTAQRIYNEADIVPKSDVRRQIAKSVLFTLLFGGGPEKMMVTANEGLKGTDRVALPQIIEARDGLFRAFPGIKGFQRQIQDMAVENLENTGRAFIRGIDNRILMMSENDDRYYAFVNWLIQSSATILLKQRLAVMHAMGLDPYLTCAIHDEILGEVPTEDCEDYSHAIVEAMNDLHQFDVPITAEPGTPAQRLGDAK